MKILVLAKPAARRAFVQRVGIPMPGFDACFSIAVKEQPVDGRANSAIGRALADHLSLPRSSVRIIAGHSAKKKVFLAAEQGKLQGLAILT